MKIFPDSSGRRYYPISQYYKKRFGERVHKITVGVAETCPNRAAAGGEGCVFCDQWGSAGNRLMKDQPLQQQIRSNRQKLHERFKVDKFLVYFQPFTNTYSRLSELEKNIELSLEEDQVCGVVLGTRPDCLPPEIFPFLKRFHEQSFISVELGVQSFLDERLIFLNRGHNVDHSIRAIHQLHEDSGVDIGIHLIFGLPAETDSEIVEAANTINNLPVGNVKLHNLHVLANTPLEDLYRKHLFKPVELDEYARKVVLFLEWLSPDIAVQRLAAFAGRWNDLVAPEWTGERLKPSQNIQERMKSGDTHQGKHIGNNT